MKEGDQEVIDALFRVRVRNNDPWKRLMEIALRWAPDEAREALREIAANDQTITALMRDLTVR